MTSGAWISIVALAACLALPLSALHAHRIGARKGVVIALAWAAIFALVAAAFSWEA
jgi:hypothetical protein